MKLEKGRISIGEFHVLVMLFIIGSSILLIPASLAVWAEQDAWIAAAVTMLTGCVFPFLYHQLASLYPSLTYIEISEQVLGKWFGKLMTIPFLFYFLELVSASLREIGDFFATQILVETPVQMIMLMFLITSLIAVKLGLEVICRTALIFLPWTIGLFFLILVFLAPEIKWENIQPVLGNGIKPVLRGVYQTIGLPYLELVLFLMIIPYIAEQEKVKKVFYSGMLIGGLVLTIIVLFSILVLGADISARQMYPTYLLGKKISIGGFLERIEVMVAIIWVFTLYFKMTICYYGLSLGFVQFFGLKTADVLIFPLAFLIMPSALFWYPDSVYFHQFTSEVWTPLSLTIGLFLPLLLLMVGKFRKGSKLNPSK